jgi:hypothetical protein
LFSLDSSINNTYRYNIIEILLLYINCKYVGSTLLPVICYIEVFFKICFAVSYYCQISSSVYHNLSMRFAIDFKYFFSLFYHCRDFYPTWLYIWGCVSCPRFLVESVLLICVLFVALFVFVLCIQCDISKWRPFYWAISWWPSLVVTEVIVQGEKGIPNFHYKIWKNNNNK